jgi:hypothetical protein
MEVRPGPVPGGEPTPDPALAMLRGGAVPSAVVGALIVVVAVVAGRREFYGAVIGLALATVAMAAGPLVMRVVRHRSAPTVMAVAVLSFGTVVTLLGAAFLLFSPMRWFSSAYVAAGLIAVGGAWVFGQARAVARLRVLAFPDGNVSGEQRGRDLS